MQLTNLSLSEVFHGGLHSLSALLVTCIYKITPKSGLIYEFIIFLYCVFNRELDAGLEFVYAVANATRTVPGATKVSDVIDLPTLTHIFQVMQVKYGSRWLSSFFMMPNQMYLIEDPEKLASDLYGE